MGTREQDLRERQDIFTGPVQEKSTWTGRPAWQRQSGAGAGKRFLVLFRIFEQDQELIQTRPGELVMQDAIG